MRLTKFSVKNFRSIVEAENITIEPVQALVGGNNCGKSNCLRALQCFLTSGSGGMGIEDFNDASEPCVIECEFSGLVDEEAKRLRPYMLGDKVVLRKEIRVVHDDKKDKDSVKGEYHGYQAEPKDEWLSIQKIEEAAEGRVNWKKIAEENGFLEDVVNDKGGVTKDSYKKWLEGFLAENDVEYDEPVLGDTHALGIPQNLLATLPQLHLLPAITDYSDEIDRRSSSTFFRRLMADLSDRIMDTDPRHQELKAALETVRALLNSSNEEGAPPRLEALGGVEDSLRDVIKRLMPSVEAVQLEVEVEEARDIFSRGVTIRIDDGVITDVLDKGHGMQRSVVFALLQMLISSSGADEGSYERPIILAIEEPELYIHPHSQRLIFRVLKEFAGVTDAANEPEGSDQVIYTTHSPSFIEVWNYHRVGVVRKPDLNSGTIVCQAQSGILGNPDDEKVFKTLTCFGLKHNEVFFADDAIIVEGPEDEIAVIAAARKLGRIVDLPDEIGVSIIVAGGKGDIKKFQKVLNAFSMQYGVLLEQDGHNDAHPENAAILAELNGNRLGRIPDKLEALLGVAQGHFKDQREARIYFDDPANINAALEGVVGDLLP